MYRGIVPQSSLVTVRTTSVIYKNDHIKELIDDELLLPSAILSKESGQLLSLVTDAMEETHKVAQVVGKLGFHLDLANGGLSGKDNTAPKAELHAKTTFYRIIDEKFPRWLATLISANPKQAHAEWRTYLLHEGRAQGIALTNSFPPTAFIGRRRKIKKNKEENIDVGKALAWFHAALNKAIPQTETTHIKE